MKKAIIIVVLVWLCGMPASAAADSRYAIFKIMGDVKLMQAGTWVVPTKKQGVTHRDRFLLGENARVGIVDNETHRIYYSDKMGKLNVAQIISSAKKQSDEVVGLINKQLRSAMVPNGESRVPVAGVSYRGSSQDSTLATLCAVLHRAISERTAGDTKMLQVERVKDDDCFFFRIKNVSDTPLYVNVLDYSRPTPRVCFNIGYTCDEPYLLIPAGQTVDMEQFVFVDSGERPALMPFATEVPVDVQALQLLLNRGTETSDEPVREEGIKVYLGSVE